MFKEDTLFNWLFACARNLTDLQSDGTSQAASTMPGRTPSSPSAPLDRSSSAASVDTTRLLRTLWIKSIAYALGNIRTHRLHRIKDSISYSHTYIAELLVYSFTPLCDAPRKYANVRPHLTDSHRLFYP